VHQISLNPLSMIIVDEALNRGIDVEIIDSKLGYFCLTKDNISVVCHESLSELTSSIASSICNNKFLSSSILRENHINTTNQLIVEDIDSALLFLEKYKKVVLKPIDGEQGNGVIVGISSKNDLISAYTEVKSFQKLIIEDYIEGIDVRFVIIDYQVIAVASRTPPILKGDGISTINQLIENYNKKSLLDSDGISFIPIDIGTMLSIASSNYTLESILKDNQNLQVRMNSNVHTGGTIKDITNDISDDFKNIAIKIAKIINIPVVGIDMMIPSLNSTEYTFIEANERPGLINHEPYPTAEKFIDFIFKQK